jgi:hypothetical protein
VITPSVPKKSHLAPSVIRFHFIRCRRDLFTQGPVGSILEEKYRPHHVSKFLERQVETVFLAVDTQFAQAWWREAPSQL